MKVAAALAGGLAGTVTIASLHEALRRISPNAPRMDLLDMELVRKGLKTLNKKQPTEQGIQRLAVGGELFSDTAYYGLAGIGSKKSVWLRGAVLGLVAGITAAVLPKPLHLHEEPANKTVSTTLMTIGLYLAGGLVAAAMAQLVENASADEENAEPLSEVVF
jgi:hypothetical protein